MTDEQFRKDVTDADIDRICGVEIAELMGRVVPRADGGGGNSGETANGNDKQAPGTDGSDFGHPETLKAELIEFLESIVDKPNLSVTQRRDYLGESTGKFEQRKKLAIANGYAEELAINLGHATRGIVKLLELTPKGHAALGKKAPVQRPRNVSAEHWWYQRAYAAWAREQGFKAELEMRGTNGKRADIGVVRDGKVLAVEIALSPNNEVRNVVADLDGFDSVLVACKNSRVRAAVEARLKVLTLEQRSRVKLALLSDAGFIKSVFRH